MTNYFITITLFLLLFAIQACSSINSAARETRSSPTKQPSTELSAAAEIGPGQLDFVLVNLTGTRLHTVYVSPNHATGWEENIISARELKDGDSLTVHFNPDERTTVWDLKVVGVDNRYSEWKALDLAEISRVTLRLKGNSEVVVVAEVE